ncbi:MAG: segregation/condensation protein A, partial [Aquificota bacterium]
FESQEQEGAQEIVEKMEKVKEAIKRLSVKTLPKGRRKKERRFPVHISRFETALEELRQILKEQGIKLSFFDLIKGKNPVPYFMALMNLYQEGVVEIYQGEPYRELYVEVLIPSPSAPL